MSTIKKGIIALIGVVLAVFTVVFLLNAYNKGDIGKKADKVAKSFSEQLEGTWYGKSDISKITFKADGTTTLKILGVEVSGTYQDTFDLENDTHTLKLKYKTIAGVSVERDFKAKLSDDEEKLTLKDEQFDMVNLVFTRSADEGSEQQSSSTSKAPSNKPTDGNDTTADAEKTLKVLKNDIVSEWKDPNVNNSGYRFREDSTVTIKLLGISYEGDYSLSIDADTGKCLLRITYASIGTTKVTNAYFITIENDVLSLSQRGAESIVTTYERV